MTPLQLLGRLRSLDVKIWVEDGRLRVSAPKGILTPALQADMAAHKTDLLALLTSDAQPPLTIQAGRGPAPLSFSQRRLWFLEQLEPGNPAYHVSLARWLPGPLDHKALDAALSALIERHAILRTRIVAEEGEPVQVVDPPVSLTIPVTDLSARPENERWAARDQLAAEEVARPFDLAGSGPIRGRLFYFGPDGHDLFLVVHHIAVDWWSVNILADELAQLYEACASGRPSSLSPLPIQYADFSRWQREWLQGDRLEGELAYWRTQLSPPPEPLELPFDHPRPASPRYAGGLQGLSLSRDIWSALSALIQQERVTPFMFFVAAFQLLLFRYTGRRDILIGTPIANRTRVELERLIGFFSNTLVLRTDLSAGESFRTLLARVRDTTLAAYAHQDMPFEVLVERLQPERTLSVNPFFQVSLVYEAAGEGVGQGGIRVNNGASPFDLTLFVRHSPSGVYITFEYARELFEPATIARLVGHFETLLASVAADPTQPVGTLPILTDAERRWLLEEQTATVTDYPRDARVHELFEAEALRNPEWIALEQGERSMTYGALNHRADSLASRLAEVGVAPGSRVAIWLSRGFDLIASCLAVLKAGGVYVPLDQASPAERLAGMIEDAGVAAVITERAMEERLPAHAAAVIRVDELAADAPAAAVHASQGSALDPAYIMFTSGSTGRPKGVVVPHRAIVRLVHNTNYARLTSDEVFLQLAPVSFDAAPLEIWGALLNGARLALYPPEPVSLDGLARAIARHRVSLLWLTAGLFHQVVEERLDALRPVRQLLAGGDVLSPPHVRRVLEAFPGICLINGYGPTENTTFTCCYSMTAPDQVGARVPIGRPIANTTAYLLDAAMQPVPIGITGELWAGGDGLALGYVNAPALTAERFLPDPFGAPGNRVYRTGDLARYRPDGVIEFLGRRDAQVKIRGYRIELGEVEAALRDVPGVQQAVVVAGNGPAGKQLLAYVVGDPRADLTVSAVRAALTSRLPEYMLPSAVVRLDALPLTENGKVDRRALPAPDLDRQKGEPPRDDLESLLAETWEELLQVRPVHRDDNFFELGGHSLLAVKLFARLEARLGRPLPLALLFRAPTIASLAAALRTGGTSGRWRSLVRFNDAGKHPPLVCIPGVGGNVVGFGTLAQVLGPDQPCYGLQSRGLDGSAPRCAGSTRSPKATCTSCAKFSTMGRITYSDRASGAWSPWRWRSCCSPPGKRWRSWR